MSDLPPIPLWFSVAIVFVIASAILLGSCGPSSRPSPAARRYPPLEPAYLPEVDNGDAGPIEEW